MKLNFLFPSQKKIDKFPVVRIAGDENRFCKWMVEHPEIDPRVPPIYQNFVITSEHCTFVVCYNDTITGFYAKCQYETVYIGAIFVDYSKLEGNRIKLQADIPDSIVETVDPNWLYSFCNAACSMIAGVQAYMLYHKPEIVEQIYTPGEERKSSTKKKRITQQPIKVRKTKIKRITLTEQDKPQKEIHYNKLSWHVRGHYKHVGKDKHLVYIQPGIRNRNGKRYSLKGQTYEIEDPT